jgi:excisionase family DNA binding protein
VTIDKYLTVRQAAAERRTTVQAIRGLIQRRRLRAVLIGGIWLISPADLKAFRAAKTGPKKSGKK